MPYSCDHFFMATIVAFHAHPDDEVLLTGGTLARLAAEGHRVVIVVACDGLMGSASGPDGQKRLNMLRASAAALGVHSVRHLGYADSGHGPILFEDPPDRPRFVRADVGEASERLADILAEENADLLLSYDASGGYGHPDHRKVHVVGAQAAQLTKTRVLEATLPRELVNLFFYPMRLLRLARAYDPNEIRASYTARSDITHRINVKPYAGKKQSALAAHAPEAAKKGRAAGFFSLMLALPVPLFGIILGREWFSEPGASRSKVLTDVLQPAHAESTC